MSAQAPIREMIDSPTTGTRRQTASNTQRIELRIGGMTCAHCSPAIEKALTAVPGVTSAQVNLTTKVARIEYDDAPSACSADALLLNRS
jgi:copper chaperone CopZ